MSFYRDFLILVGKKWHANCSKFNRNLTWNLLYACIPRLVTFQMMLFCFRILNLGFWDVFWSTKSARNRDLARLTFRDLPPKKGGKHKPWTWSSMGPFNAAKDYVVQHAPCDVGIIKVDSNDPVTRPAGGKQYDTSVEKTAVSFIFPFFLCPFYMGGWHFPLGNVHPHALMQLLFGSMKQIKCTLVFEMLLTNHRMSNANSDKFCRGPFL